MKTLLSEIFRPVDPATARSKALAELSATRTALADLERQRGEALAGDTSIADIRRIDRETEEGRATVVLLEDRIARLGKAVRREELARRERARDAAIESEIRPRFNRICELAERLEGAALLLAECYRDLQEEERAINRDWPAAVKKPPYWSGGFSLWDIRGRLQQACTWASSGSLERFGEFLGIGSSETIGAMVGRQTASALTELRNVEIELPNAADDLDVEPVAAAPAVPAPVTGFAAMGTAP
jgi:hypothetical protein